SSGCLPPPARACRRRAEGAARRQWGRALRLAPEFSPLHAERARREPAALGGPEWGPPPA
ncbi:hypothetical protein, partial [Streptomyces diastaticus]